MRASHQNWLGALMDHVSTQVWSPREDESLAACVAGDMLIATIAARLERSPDEVALRIMQLGLRPPRVAGERRRRRA